MVLNLFYILSEIEIRFKFLLIFLAVNAFICQSNWLSILSLEVM